MNVKELKKGMKNVEIKLELGSSSSHKLTYPDGSVHDTTSFWAKDDTGRVMIIFKDEETKRVRDNDIILIKNANINLVHGNFMIGDKLNEKLDFKVVKS